MSPKDAAYARYSSSKQDKGCSIETQLEACHRASGRDCVDYVDRAKTGRTTVGRVQLARLLEDVRRREIGRVFVYRWDRLGRSILESSGVVQQLEDQGVKAISVTEGEDPMCRGISLVVAEHYSRTLSRRVRDAHLTRFEADHSWRGGPPPYGYTLVKDERGRTRLAVNPEEARVVRWVFERYLAESVGFKKLAAQLNAEGVRPRKGGIWNFISIANCLKNRVYTGLVEYCKAHYTLDRRTGGKRHSPCGPEERRGYRDEGLRIIDDDLFGAVQQKRDARTGSHPTPRGQVHAFTGVLHCKACGAILWRRSSRPGSRQYHYYTCSRRITGGPAVCMNHTHVNEAILLKTITQSLVYVLDHRFDDVQRQAVGIATQVLASKPHELAEAESGLRQTEQKAAKLLEALQDASQSDSPSARVAIIRELDRAEIQKEELLRKCRRLSVNATTSAEVLQVAVCQVMSEVRAGVGSVATEAEIHELVRTYVGPMLVDVDGSFGPSSEGPQPDVVVSYTACLLPTGGCGYGACL